MIELAIKYIIALTCARTIIMCQAEGFPVYLTEYTVACAALTVMFAIARRLQ